MLKVLDLFSGIGGFSLGLERTGGFETVAFCEIDPFCRKVLAKHWPDMPIYEDITKVKFEHGQADIITGGFPCQDISYAGYGAGLTGERSGLYRESLRAIRLVRPKYAILENVAALLNRGLGTVLGDLAEIGNDAEWDCIPNCAVGARHIRDRVRIIATPTEMDNTNRIYPRCVVGPPDKKGWWTADYPKRPCFGWGTWAREPAVARVAYGVPDRMDRLIGLGNAENPEIPEMLGYAILEAEGLK